MLKMAVGALLAHLALAGAALAEEGQAAKMLGKMQGLAGAWEGTFEWSGARTHKGELRATYHVSSAGSTVVEELIMGGEPSMLSVYHLDGGDLRMTHYCAARNQPRLKAGAIDAAAGHATFDFVDVTNVTSNTEGYVEGFEMKIIDADTLNIKFTFKGGGPLAIEDIKLKRVQGGDGPA